MIRTIFFTIAAGGVVMASAAIPRSLVVRTDSAMPEPGAMILLAIALFGIASVVKRNGNGPRRR